MLGLLGCVATIVDVEAQDVARFGFTRHLMGTEVKIVLYAADSIEADNAAGQAFARIKELNARLSDYLTGNYFVSGLRNLRLFETICKITVVSDEILFFSNRPIA
ncbi:MAG: hypothetical protein OXD43_05880 [Bacteroidetes bacterium]|nr:hypothetical protein [Bacteroidota bacterium]